MQTDRKRQTTARRPEGTPRNGRGRPAQISRDQILAVARNIPADKFTMPVIAARLGVNPAALYYHFRSRDALLAEVSALLVNDFRLTPADAVRWRAWLERTTTELYRFLLDNPVTLEVESWSRIAGIGLPLVETVLETLEGAGFDGKTALQVWSVVADLAYSHARGVHEAPKSVARGSRHRAVVEISPAVGSDFPRLQAALGSFTDRDHRQLFADTLHWLVSILPDPKGGPQGPRKPRNR